MRSLFNLDGRVAVVTGSSRGIGKAIATRFAEYGAKVVITSRKGDACEAVAAELRANGFEAIAVPCNASKKSDLESLVTTTIQTWGRIDIAVANAASNPFYGPMSEIPDSAIDKIIDTNIKGVIWLANLVAPQMAQRRDGAIIIISSIGGFAGSDKVAVYNMTKAAEQSLTRSLAVEWGPHNVRVNCIAPGAVRTDLAQGHDARDAPRIHAPLARIAEPEEVSGTAVYLASAASSYVTGQTLVVDGGRLIHKLKID